MYKNILMATVTVAALFASPALHAADIYNTSTLMNRAGDLRKVVTQDDLKNMSDSLCVEGFKSYTGNDRKNVCQGKASLPDLAYSCVWVGDGDAAYAPTHHGPCALELSEHRQSVMITKTEFNSDAPFAYGTEVHCCFRAAQGPSSTNTNTVQPTSAITIPVVR